MKTVKQWFKEGLNKEDYEKAEKYESENWDWKAESLEDALLDAFTWDKTDEGWNYWDKIFSNGGSLQADTNTQEIDNNGWIKIESEADLPKEKGSYYCYDKDGFITDRTFYPDGYGLLTEKGEWGEYYSEILEQSDITHYQKRPPLPKPPKF